MWSAINTEPEEQSTASSSIVLDTQHLDFFYHSKQVLRQVTLGIAAKSVTALIGPSGCGKSTLLRTFNRMNDFIEGARLRGGVHYRGQPIYGSEIDVSELRRRVGMVFQKSTPFPKSIFDNVAYGPRIHGEGDKDKLTEIVERCLKSVALWDEVKDRLKQSALSLSGGQQQRLCIARTLAVEPEVVLMDEPCSALDPASTAKIEALIRDLGTKYSIMIVTHNLHQAQRVAASTAFLLQGELVEYGATEQIFTAAVDTRTRDYISGRFG